MRYVPAVVLNYGLISISSYIESCLSFFCKNLSTLVLNFVKKKRSRLVYAYTCMCELGQSKNFKKVGLIRFCKRT